MGELLTIPLPGTLGTNKGAASDGVLVGKLTQAQATKFFLRQLAQTDGYCITDDGGTFKNESTEFNNATADDVEIMLTAVDDANYFGHATKKPTRLDLVIGVQGVAGASAAVVAWEYSKGAGVWGTLAGVTDGTTAFTAGTGTVSVTFTAPTDMAADTVDGVNAFWIRARHASGDAHATPAELDRGYVVVAFAESKLTDDTTDFNDAGTGDVDLLPAYTVVGDGGFIVFTEKFTKLLLTTSQARTGTLTVTWKYWNGTSWATITTVADDSAGFATTAGALLVHFAPPSDWVANTAANAPDATTAGYWVSYEVTAFTSYTQQPLLTSGRVFPLTTGAAGIKLLTADARTNISITEVTLSAMTVSGSTADSKFMVFNLTRGTYALVTWTKATGFLTVALASPLVFFQSDELAIMQVQEDGSTEYADGFMALKAA